MRRWIVSCLAFLLSVQLAHAQVGEQISLEQMRRDLVKLNRSVDETKDKIKKINDARFLPDLYFALGEFLVEKARYMYAIKIADNPKTPLEELDFTAEKRPKLEAIQVYDTIIEKFPKIDDRDKAIFYKAHELREMGRLEDMIRAYSQLTVEYPKSDYWTESQIIIGDYFFEEKKDMDLALEVYRKILSRPPGAFTPLAHYKIGWVFINKSNFKESLLSFERVLTQNKDIDLMQLPEIYRRTDVRREALLAMVWPYSEIEPKEMARLGQDRGQPIRYFFSLAPDKVSYEKLLSRLGKRLTLKQRFVEATKIYFELLRLTGDVEDRMDVIERLYVSMKNTQLDWPIRGLVVEIANTLAAVENSSAVKAAAKKKARHDFEIFARDIATRENKRAKRTRSKDDWAWTVRDYQTYMTTFPESKYFATVKLNLAESFFNNNQPVEAGREYEWLAKNSKDKKKAKEFFDSAIQSYISAIRNQSQLTRLQLTESRYGLRDVGRGYIASYPGDRNNEDILFNIGQTFYDERKFDKAVGAFKEYINKYPRGARTSVAANLILDAFNQKEDYKGIIAEGKAILANTKVTDSALKQQIGEIVQQAEMKAVQSQAGDFSSPDYTSNLLKLARKYKGSSMGDQALYEAFVALRSKKDPRAYESGEQLLMQHRTSKYALEVATSMGQMALITADFRRASLYFELFYERYPAQNEAREMLRNSAKMRELMGDFKLAAQDYKKLGDNLSAARMDFLSADWTGLMRSAPLAGGIQSAYWEGLANYRLRGIGAAQTSFQRASQMAGSGFEEQEMAAHSLYLLSMAAMDNYKAIQMRAGAEAKAVADKAAMLKSLDAQLNRVIQFGNGRWTIAALFGLGQANAEFARFVEGAPIPAGLSGDQANQYKGVLAQQAANYKKAASEFFGQCIANSEKFEVFTEFVKGCQSGGREQIDEAKETAVIAKARETSPPEAEVIRKQLYDKPRDVSLLMKLAEVHVKAQDYSMAELILNRASEIEPENAVVLASIGSVNLFKNDPIKAKVWFDRARQKQSKNPLALWSMAGLYKRFNFKQKHEQIMSLARSAGQPAGIVHPLGQGRD